METSNIVTISLDTDTFQTGTGRELQTDYFASMPMPPFAYIRVLRKTFLECAQIFSDPEEVKEITYNSQKLTGYRMVSLTDEGDAIKVQLSR